MHIRLKEFEKPKKGRGLGYQGSKRLIAYDLAETMEGIGDFSVFVDAFGGGGAMTCEFLMRGKPVIYNDADRDIYEMFRYILTERVNLRDFLISRETYNELKAKQNRSPKEKLQLLVNTFGNTANSFSYLYGKDKSKEKYELALSIYDSGQDWRRYRHTPVYKQRVEQLQRLEQLEQLQRLQQLEQLQRLQQLEQLEQLEFFNQDYKIFIRAQRNVDALLYCDIPYRGTLGYKVPFDHDEFFRFIHEEKRYYKAIFISSYCEEGLEMVKKFKKRETMSVGKTKRSGVETLYRLVK